MGLIQSNSCLFQVLVDGVYKTVMCLKSFNLNPTTIEKEITPPGNGKFKSFDYKQLSYSVSGDGILYRQNATDPVIFDFAEYQKNFLEVKFRALYKDDVNQYKVVTGQAIVRNCNIEVNAGQIGSGTFELLGQGEYITADSLPEFVNLRIFMHGALDQAFLQFRLINDEGEAIFQTDQLPQASGGNLANPIDVTVPVPKGNWSYWFQVVSNIVGNVFTLSASPGKTTNFNDGTFNESSFGVQVYDFNSDRTVDINLGVGTPPPTCVPVSISGSLPSGTQFVPYSALIPLIGSAPFVISNVFKPAWMNITTTVIGGVTQVAFTGTPTDPGILINVAFDVTNACGSTSFATTINIAEASGHLINWSFTEPPTSTAYGFRLFVNGVLAVTTDEPASGVYPAPLGASLQAMIVGTLLKQKHLKIEGTVSGVIYDQTSSTTIVNKSWTGSGTENYTVTAEGLT